jgi:hypothetical protein
MADVSLAQARLVGIQRALAQALEILARNGIGRAYGVGLRLTF